MKKIIFTILILGFATTAFADCFDQCMSIKNCWHKGESYSSNCGDAEVNCNMSCEREAANRKSYGAIAYSRKDGAYGYSNSQDSQKEAEDLALNYCKENGAKCRSMIWFQNSCGAVAAAGRKTGWGQADTEEEAQTKALKDCGKKNCEIKVAHCSGV